MKIDLLKGNFSGEYHPFRVLVFCSLIRNFEDMNAIVKSNLPEIRALMMRFGVIRAFLFGSAATDEMTEESDVDFLITFDSALDYTTYGDNYFELMYALQDLLKRDIELVAEETLSNPYLLQKINSQKIAVL